MVRFVERLDTADWVIVVGTPLYRIKSENRHREEGNVLAAESELIGKRLLGSDRLKSTVLPLLVSGSAQESFPPLLQTRGYLDLRDDARYFDNLLDVIAEIHSLGGMHRGVQQRLREHGAEVMRTLASDA